MVSQQVTLFVSPVIVIPFFIICTISFEIHRRERFVDKVDLGIQISMTFKNVSFHRCQHSSIEEEANMWSKLISSKS